MASVGYQSEAYCLRPGLSRVRARFFFLISLLRLNAGQHESAICTIHGSMVDTEILHRLTTWSSASLVQRHGSLQLRARSPVAVPRALEVFSSPVDSVASFLGVKFPKAYTKVYETQWD